MIIYSSAPAKVKPCAQCFNYRRIKDEYNDDPKGVICNDCIAYNEECKPFNAVLNINVHEDIDTIDKFGR